MSRSTDILADLQSRTALSDADAAAELSTLTVSVITDSPLLAIENTMLMSGEWGAIEDAAHTSADANIRKLCRNVLRLFTDSKEKSLGWGDDPLIPEKVEYMLTQLVNAGLMGQATKSTILGMKIQQVLKYQPSVHHLEVAAARGRG